MHSLPLVERRPADPARDAPMPRWWHVDQMRYAREMTPQRAERLARQVVPAEASVRAIGFTAFACVRFCGCSQAWSLVHPAIVWC